MVRILRDHTPNIPNIGDEDMVPAAWRHAGVVIKEKPLACSIWARKSKSEIPCRASSDPHEWRNELGAVSDRYSAKLQYL